MNGYDNTIVGLMLRQADTLERIADALERARQPEMEKPETEQMVEVFVTWQEAVEVMRTVCIEADECGPGCPMNTWCQSFNKEGSAPAKWEPIENGEEDEE